jgi:uncharacterized protein (UPF0261 family)
MAIVVLLGTLDTKGEEYDFVRSRLNELGVDTCLVDMGILGRPRAEPDISRAVVAKAAGTTLKALARSEDRGTAVGIMAEGGTRVVRRLFEDGKVDGIIGLGGTGGTTMVTRAMRDLPFGLPKIMVSTVASGDTRPYLRASDIVMMNSVVDIAGLNTISRRVLSNAAAAMAGMVSQGELTGPTSARPLIGATMFGVTTPCVDAARKRLEEKGYEVLVFHATGAGGEAMEALVRSGVLAGVLDITTTELADDLVGGVFSAGPDRLEAAGAAGIPQVVSVGALDMVNFGRFDDVPSAFAGRRLYRHNASVTLMRTTPQECAELGRRIGKKLSRAQGPVSVFLPLRGVSLISTEGQPFRDAEADSALFDGLRGSIDGDVVLEEWDTHINDVSFAEAMADRIGEYCPAGVGR